MAGDDEVEETGDEEQTFLSFPTELGGHEEEEDSMRMTLEVEGLPPASLCAVDVEAGDVKGSDLTAITVYGMRRVG